MMTANKFWTLGLAALLSLVLWPQSARANDWNQMTMLVFDHPVEIPGQVLPAGTYRFEVGPSDSDRNTIAIYSADWKHLYAICDTVPVELPKTMDYTELRFAERSSSSPEALLDWFYPGETEGHEFLYSARTERELARDAKHDVEASPTLAHARQPAVDPAVAPAAGEN